MWKELITFLMNEAGMSQRDIAEAVESSQQHISDLYNERRGKRIGYELAKKLEALRDKKSRELRRAEKKAA